MNDKLINWYETIDKKYKGAGIKEDKQFKNHYIQKNSMIGVVGPTGSGKTSFLLSFLHRKNDSFTKIIIFTGSTSDEPIYRMLKDKIPEIEIYDKVEELPNLDDMGCDEKNTEKLIVFDDFINLPKKELKQIQKFFNSGRKYGYTVMALMQNITDAPIQLRRNIQIWILFKLNDINTIRNILKTTNNNDTDFKLIKQAYIISTQKKGDFFKINLLSGDDNRFSHNFLDFFSL
jgi:GTPase SAR1 family protein